MSYPLLLTHMIALVLLTRSTAPKSIACPVMTTNTVDVATATKRHLFVDYSGRRYFFCCAMCPIVFKGDPKRFADRPSIAIPK